MQRDEFVITTPDDTARKDYIGNAALHGRLAVVFAQLEVGGDRHGVHAILVPIRNGDGDPMPDVYIEDCGEKLGLNGVDNGRLGFADVRVPRENLLNRFADITSRWQLREHDSQPRQALLHHHWHPRRRACQRGTRGSVGLQELPSRWRSPTAPVGVSSDPLTGPSRRSSTIRPTDCA